MRLSIYTKYLPATNSRGPRIRATTGEDYPGHTATIEYSYTMLGTDAEPWDAHWQAAKVVADNFNWHGEYIAGTTKDGYVFTPVENPRFFAGDRLAVVKCAPFEYSALFQIMDAHPRQWVPTTEKMFHDMLEVLPPVAYTHVGRWTPSDEKMYHDMLGVLPPVIYEHVEDTTHGWTGFLMGEPVTHNTQGDAIYGAYICLDGKFYAQNMTVKDFKDLPKNLELY